MKVKVIERKGRGFVLRWKDGDTWKEQKCNASSRQAAERAAGHMEASLESGKEPVVHGPDSWHAFSEMHLEAMAMRGCRRASIVMSRRSLMDFAKAARVVYIPDINNDSLRKYRDYLDSKNLRPSSIAGDLARLRAAIRWGVDQGMIQILLKFRDVMPRYDEEPRGGAITEEQFGTLLELAKDEDLRLLLRILWTTGLRLSEALNLRWEPTKGSPHLALKPEPHVVFPSGTQKRKTRRDELWPLPPAAIEVVESIPEGQRNNYVCRFECHQPHDRRQSYASVAISALGKNIVTDRGTYMTAHDLRRSFGTYWAERLDVIDLKDLMRHRKIETTLTFYRVANISKLSKKLRESA